MKMNIHEPCKKSVIVLESGSVTSQVDGVDL